MHTRYLTQMRRGGAAAVIPPQTVVLIAGTDATAYQFDPATNYGSINLLAVGSSVAAAQGKAWRSWIKFDLAPIPDDAVITSASLSLFALTDNSANARTFRAYKCKRAFVDTQLTWNIYSTGNNWQTAGGTGANDYDSTAVGSRDFTAAETLNEFKVFPLTVTSKTDLANGLLLMADTESEDRYDFASFNHATPANHPQLSLTFTSASNPGFGAANTVIDQGGIVNATVAGVALLNGALYFDGRIGAYSYESVFSAGAAAKFNGTTMSVIVRAKAARAGMWTSSVQRDLFRWDGAQVDSHMFACDKQNTGNALRGFYWCTGGYRTITLADMSAVTDWFTYGMVVDVPSNTFRTFLDGAFQNIAYTGTNPLDTFNGPLSQAYIGATNHNMAGVGYNWHGWIGDVVAGYGVKATDVQMGTLHTKIAAGTLAAADLNTIFGAGNWSWWRNNVVVAAA